MVLALALALALAVAISPGLERFSCKKTHFD
jgi:hypothetical protein